MTGFSSAPLRSTGTPRPRGAGMVSATPGSRHRPHHTHSVIALWGSRICLFTSVSFVEFQLIEYINHVGGESLRCLSAKYCPLVPSPRSTITAPFSADGKILASTQHVVSNLCFVLFSFSLIIY
ncbi:hypothetical protein L1887_35539 [Cichorium endivia]|nr:hypothetical protein L1887_35539 [Cichorium endivia]